MKTSSLWRMTPLLAPTQLLLISVIVIPSIYVVWLSFHASTYGQGASFVGLENYIRVLADPGFHSALWNAVVLVVVAVHLELFVALGMALLFNSGLWGRRLLLVVVLAPYAVSEVVAVAMWRFLSGLSTPSRHVTAPGAAIFGIRPHALSLNDGPNRLKRKISLIERMGPETVINLILPSAETLVAVLPGGPQLALDQEITLSFAAEDVHLFPANAHH